MKVSFALALLVITLAVAPPSARSQQKSLEPSDSVLASAEKAIQQGHAADAQKILSDAISQAEKEDAHSPRLANYLEQQAGLLDQAAPSEALALYQRALQINQDAFGPKDERVEEDLYRIGMAQRNPVDAERFLKQALDITHLNRNVPSYASVWAARSLAGIYTEEQRFSEADQLLLDTQRTCAQSPDDRGACDLSFEFSRLYRAEGQLPKSEQADKQNESSFYGPAVADINFQARRYEAGGAYEQAAKAYSDGITWFEKNNTAFSKFSLPAEYDNLGEVLKTMGRYDDAEKAFLKELDLEEQNARSFGPQGVLRDLGGHTGFDELDFDGLLEVYRDRNRLTDAEPIIQHAIDLQEKLLSPDDPSLARTLLALADLYQEEGDSDKTKYAQASPLYERALDIRQTALGPDDWRLTEILEPYADLLGKLHQDAEAATVQARIRALENR